MFDFDMLTDEDKARAENTLGVGFRQPDLTIAPDGSPYLYRWHVVPRNNEANVYFHIQVQSDPDRPLHDHPWDNTSVILSGGYDEVLFIPESTASCGGPREYWTRKLRKGDVVHRPATQAHRLILPKDIPYTMTMFTTGPHVREWGFWTPDGWVHNDKYTELLPDGRSVVREEFMK